MKINNYIFPVVFFMAILATGQDAYIAVKAEKGDGVYSLLRKQGVDPYETFDDFIALNSENLRDSIHLYEGRTYFLPSVDSTSTTKADKVVAPKWRIVFPIPYSGWGIPTSP